MKRRELPFHPLRVLSKECVTRHVVEENDVAIFQSDGSKRSQSNGSPYLDSTAEGILATSPKERLALCDTEGTDKRSLIGT
jgi:hypothetical protein